MEASGEVISRSAQGIGFDGVMLVWRRKLVDDCNGHRKKNKKFYDAACLGYSIISIYTTVKLY